jgi:hypothetical protein
MSAYEIDARKVADGESKNISYDFVNVSSGEETKKIRK